MRRRRLECGLAIFLFLLLGLAVAAFVSRDDEPPNDPPRPVPRPLELDPAEVRLGRKLYRRQDPAYGCATCHGLHARGSTLGPALRGAAAVYLERLDRDPEKVRERVVRHLEDPDAFPALNSDGDYIAPMPPYRALPPRELRALASYVLSLSD
jgi:mono/diheme cytochrome c family protein